MKITKTMDINLKPDPATPKITGHRSISKGCIIVSFSSGDYIQVSRSSIGDHCCIEDSNLDTGLLRSTLAAIAIAHFHNTDEFNA